MWNISAKLSDVALKIRIISSCLIPHVDYCNSLYVCLPKKQINKLQRLVNASVRFIFNLRRFDRVSISSYSKKCHFLPVQYRVNFKICLLAYKCFNNMAPKYLQNLTHSKVSLQSLRISDDKYLLQTPTMSNLDYKNRSFYICAPRIWNSLPLDIRSCSSIDLFKSKLKTYYFTQAYD